MRFLKGMVTDRNRRGFKQYWQPSEGEPEQRVYSKVYTLDVFLEMESQLPDIKGCTLEKAVVPLLIYSDSTHLANFGTASLWPIYIWFGNVSKYVRVKASSFSAHHLAYLPLVCIITVPLFARLMDSIDSCVGSGSLYSDL
jgi:hypothetical protein